MGAFAALGLLGLALSGSLVNARHLTHTSAECCETGFYLVDGDACPGTAAIHLNECTGENVCCSEGVVGSLHDPEHEREVADKKLGTEDLRKKDKGDHGKKAPRKRTGGGGGRKKKQSVRGKGRVGTKRRVGGGRPGRRHRRRRARFFKRLRARLARRRRRRAGKH